uniref:Cleavage and polyadenylation specificity factor subunit 3-II isoform X1 n=1 Tax=Rhizophora mucronata TaxID=61149 RepID=A0A2P2KNF5_RHIMU
MQACHLLQTRSNKGTTMTILLEDRQEVGNGSPHSHIQTHERIPLENVPQGFEGLLQKNYLQVL